MSRKNDTDSWHPETEQYYLERRLFGDDYVEALFDESEGEEREGGVRGISEVNSEINKRDKEVEKVKRIHFKGRGKTVKPTCPHCQADLKRSYEVIWNPETKKRKYVANGWECKKDKYKQWD